MILVENAPGFHDVELVDRALVPGHVEHPVQVVSDPPGLGILLAGSLEAVELTLDFLADGLRHPGVFDLLAILGGDVAVGLAKFFLDGFHLLAEEELALPLLHALLHLVADLVLEGGVGEDLAGPANQLLEALLDVERVQDLDLALEREIRGISGQVGELARPVDAADHLDDFAGATQLEQVLDQRFVLAGKDVRSLGQRVDVLRRLGQHAQRGSRPRGGAPHRGPIEALQDRDLDAVGQLAGILELGDCPEIGKATFDARHEQDETIALPSGGDGGLRLLTLQRDRDHHVRQDHPVVQGQ